MLPNQTQYNVSKQRNKEIDVIIQLLNTDFQIVDELSGSTTTDGISFNIDGSADIRRNCTLSLYVKDKTFEVDEGGKIWLNKYLQVIVREKDQLTDIFVPTNMGIYVVTNPSQTYNATTNTLTLNLLDLVCKLNGYISGNLKGLDYLIKKGENVREAIIAILDLNNITKYSVVDINEDVPTDISVDATSNYWALLIQLRDILPNYQMYFEVDGTFIFEPIPYKTEETPIATDDALYDKIISWSKTSQFDQVKNSVTVIGKTHEVKYFDGEGVVANSILDLNIDGLSTLYDGLMVGFVLSDQSQEGNAPFVRLNQSLVAFLSSGNGSPVNLQKGKYYVMIYVESEFVLLGEITAKYTSKDENPDSPYSIQVVGEERNITLSGGIYDNIWSEKLAKQHSDWELYRRTNLQESVSIEIVPTFWLNNANKIIEISLPNVNHEEQLPTQYVINSTTITYGTTATQTINATKYYPFYNN